MNDRTEGSREAAILECFCQTPSITAAALSQRLEVGERTVRNDIRLLNQDLRECASIEAKQGIWTLRVYDAERFRAVCTRLLAADARFTSPRVRMRYVFGRLMRAVQPVLTDDLAYEMSVSRSTLNSDLKKLRAELELYRLTILGKTGKGLTLQGSESDIRHYVLENAYEALYQDYPIEPEILSMVEIFFADSPYEQNTRASFLRFLTVMLDRYLTDHPIGELTISFYSLTARPEFEGVNDLAERIGEFLGMPFPPEERLFLLLPIIGMRTPADIQNMQAIELDERMRELGEKLFRQIRQELDIQIENPEAIEEFLYHLMFMINRLKFHVRMKSPLLEELREKYPLAWKMADIAARVIYSDYHLKVTSDERAFLATYFGVFLEERGERNQRPFRAAVVCGPGRVTGRLISAQLRKVLDSSAELTVFANEPVTAELLAPFDLVFTTVDLDCETDRPVIRIREVFNEQALRQKIEKARYWDRIDIPVLDDNWFVMAGLLDESRFFLFDAEVPYEDAVNRMAQSLADQGQADPDFPRRLREREKRGSMVFDHGVAIPHAPQTASSRLALSIGVFPEAIQHHGQEIRVLFLMAIPAQQAEKDDSLLIRVYEEIISVTQDAELLEKVAGAESFQALLRALYRQA